MICDNQKYNNESFILYGDIEEGICINQNQIPNICEKKYLVFELISNMSYKIMNNMKQMVSNQINYLCPSSRKKKIENYL
jgi:hypothetical protein